MESDLLGLDLSVLYIDLVTYKNNWDVLTNTGQVLVPLWHIRVGNSGADVEHDDTAVTTDVVTITETTELFLTSGVPNVELNLTMVSEESHWMDFNTESSDVLLFELTSQVTFDEGSFTSATVTDEH